MSFIVTLASLEKTIPMGLLYIRLFQWFLKNHWKFLVISHENSMKISHENCVGGSVKQPHNNQFHRNVVYLNLHVWHLDSRSRNLENSHLRGQKELGHFKENLPGKFTKKLFFIWDHLCRCINVAVVTTVFYI